MSGAKLTGMQASRGTGRELIESTRQTHEENLRPCAVKQSFAQLNLCSPPNVPTRASGTSHSTATQSRGYEVC